MRRPRSLPPHYARKAAELAATVREYGAGRVNLALVRLYGRQFGIPHAERLALSGAVSNPRSKTVRRST